MKKNKTILQYVFLITLTILSNKILSQQNNKFIFISYDISKSMLGKGNGQSLSDAELGNWNDILLKVLFDSTININNFPNFHVVGDNHAKFPIISKNDLTSFGFIGVDYKYLLNPTKSVNQQTIFNFLPKSTKDFNQGETFMSKAELEFLINADLNYLPIWVCVSDDAEAIGKQIIKTSELDNKLQLLRFRYPTVPLLTIQLKNQIKLTVRSLSTSRGPILEAILPGSDLNFVLGKNDSSFVLDKNNQIEILPKKSFSLNNVKNLSLWISICEKDYTQIESIHILPEQLPFALKSFCSANPSKLIEASKKNPLLMIITSRYNNDNILQYQDLVLQQKVFTHFSELNLPEKPKVFYVIIGVIILILSIICYLFWPKNGKEYTVFCQSGKESYQKTVSLKIKDQLFLGQEDLTTNKSKKIFNPNLKFIELQAPDYSVVKISKDTLNLFYKIKDQQKITFGEEFIIKNKGNDNWKIKIVEGRIPSKKLIRGNVDKVYVAKKN